MYHFLSGYTSKVAGTERGITDPEATFSACFGAAFLTLHPTVYADLLQKKIDEHNCNVYLVNTGWVGGGYGVGERNRWRLLTRGRQMILVDMNQVTLSSLMVQIGNRTALEPDLVRHMVLNSLRLYRKQFSDEYG